MTTLRTEKLCNTCGKKYLTDQDFISGTSRWRMCDKKRLYFNCPCGSTLLLPPGTYSWYSPTLAMSTKAASLFNTLTEFKRLPLVPENIAELQVLINDEHSDADHLAKSVKDNPTIAAATLSAANRIRIVRDPTAKELRSLSHAIAYIGRKSLNDLVIAAAVKSFPLNTKKFNENDFWIESTLVASIAEYLAKKFAPELARDEAYLAGYFCNIGKIVLALCFPDKADEVASRTEDLSSLCTWTEAEAYLSAPEHHLLGDIAAALWGFPDFVNESCLMHHRSTINSGQISKRARLIEIISLANQMMHWVRLQPSRIDQNLLSQLVSREKLTKTDVEQLGNELMPMSDLLAQSWAS